MKRLHLVLALLLLAGTGFAKPRHYQDWRPRKETLAPTHVPEPGVAAMLTVTAGTIVGALGLRRHLNRTTS